ncbi:ribbon-helix-helix protein, CopG family [Halorientalis salina]|uniref:ribbon-helix-helix protein, CopG family n=1 Tax=Halorientalis salina TaxID=2932266 RepID=UPI0010AB5279|nr:ribbon-helix-helix protein, CopG family [Halorientalis salina]
MAENFLDMDEVTIELDEAELEEIDQIAFENHRENRDAAIRDLLDQWLKERDGEE